VPFRRVDTYFVLLGAVVQNEAEMVSPFLMIVAAVPVELFVVPVITVQNLVPVGHFPMVFCGVAVTRSVVVPFPPIQVIVVVRVPATWVMGTVTRDDPPAANAPVPHLRNVVATDPVLAFRLSVDVDDTVEHDTLGFNDAAAGNANVEASNVPAAAATRSVPVRNECLMVVDPLRVTEQGCGEGSLGAANRSARL
jgi:hypothetical protein